MRVFFTVDWIGVTFKPHDAKKFGHKVGLDAYLSDVAIKGLHGYNAGRELESGLRVLWHTEKDEMGVHFSFGGAALRWYESKSLGWFELLSLIKKHNGRTSRVDLAIDIENSGLTPKDLNKANLKPYKGRGRTPQFVTLTGDRDSWTVYIGSRSSERFVRIYDKAKEQGDYDSDRVRVELELKGENAHSCGWQAPTEGKEWLVSLAKNLLRQQADFNLESWNIALSSGVVEFGIPHGRERDTFGWLTKVCAPALAKEIAKRPNSPVLDEFWEALRQSLRERGIDA